MGNLNLSVEVYCGFVVLQHILLETLGLAGTFWRFKGLNSGFY
jgi:hypothetical protein